MKLSAEEQARAEDFFKVQTAESRVKTSIVEHFFVGWARIIGNFQKKQGRAVSLAYADLFAGRGVYEDGEKVRPFGSRGRWWEMTRGASRRLCFSMSPIRSSTKC